MTRRSFGGTAADFLVDALGNVLTGLGTVWTAQTGGAQLTDLQTPTGAALVAGQVAAATGNVVGFPKGQVQFLGPNDGTAIVWADFGGGRVKLVASDAFVTQEAAASTFVPKWAPLTAYAAGDPVVNPAGDVVKAKIAFTSGAAYDATKWAGSATYVPKWQPLTAYVAGQSVVNPTGDVVTAKVDFTSGAAYSAANWNLSQTYVSTPATPGGYVAGAVPPATRRAAYVLASGLDTNGSINQAVWRYPFRLPVTTTRWRLHVRNKDNRSGTVYTGAVTFTGCWVGEHALDASAAHTGNFVTTPTQALAGFVTAADGSEYVSAWVTDPAAQISADKHSLLSVGWSCTASQTNVRTSGTCYWNQGGSTGGGNTLLSSASFILNGIYDIWVEYEFVGSNPVTLYIGDSLTQGFASARPVFDAYPTMHANANGALAVVAGFNGTVTAEWLTPSDWKYAKWAGLTIDNVVLMMGTNDNNSSVAVATIQANLLTIIANLRAMGVKRIFVGTLPPRNYSAGALETGRSTLNTWLRALPANVLGCFDFDRATRNPTTPLNIDTDFNSGDNTHMNSAGYGAMAKAVPARLSQ